MSKNEKSTPIAPVNIQSNMLRGDYMRSIVDRTINEIHEDIITVFGPGARDAFITKDQLPYFTRDGMEVMRSMKFDHPLSNYVTQMLFQAMYNQGKKVGDGTTSLAVLYTKLYLYLSNSHIDSKMWNRAIAKLNERIKKRAVPMTKELLKKMLYTCTQDEELATKIYDNLGDAILENAYITVSKSNIESDFLMDVHTSPVFKVTKQFSIRPVPNKVTNATILHCNGMLDIAHPEVITDMMSRIVGVPKTVILLCNGISEATRRTTKELVNWLNGIKETSTSFDVNQYNNVCIYTLDEYRKFDADQIEDVSTIITDEPGIGGLVQQLTFEALLYQALKGSSTEIPDLETFDTDIHHIDKIRTMFADSYEIEFDDIKGMRIGKTLGPIAQKRYEDLKKEIEEEKSEVRKISLSRRMKTMYGKFIDVQVGSKLVKDSQKKYELILDAILSASDGVEHGVLTANSFLVAIYEVMKLLGAVNIFDTITASTTCEEDVWSAIGMAMTRTVSTMLENVTNDQVLLLDFRAQLLTLTNCYYYEELGYFDITRDNLTNTNLFSEENGNPIVEPVGIITSILENTSIVVDLKNAKTFHLDAFVQNYID